MNQWTVTNVCLIKMCEIEWIKVASKSLRYCVPLLQQIKHLKESLEKLREEATRLKTLVQKLEEEDGYDTVY